MVDRVMDPGRLGIGALFYQIRDAVIAVNASTNRIVLWNPAASRMFGYSVDEAVELPLETLVPEELRDKHLAGIARYAATGRGELIDSGGVYELPALHKFGHRIFIELSLTPLAPPEGGEERYALAIVRDVSERKTLEQANADFMAMVVHDLRSPAAVAGGLATLLAENWASIPDEKRSDLLNRIASSSEHQLQMIEQLLNVARLESGEFTFNIHEFDLGEVVERTISELDRIVGSHRVEIAIPPHLPPAIGDPARNSQVLTNLLSNAAKYSPTEGRIMVSVGPDDAFLKIAVADEGPGIPEEFRDHLFKRFGRLPSEVSSAGTGLGLYICKQMVEAQGGRIWVETAPGGGSLFQFTLPKAV